MSALAFIFEQTAPESQTTAEVRKHVSSRCSLAVHGAVGSGKSFAVRAAVTGAGATNAVWVDLRRDSLLVPQFVMDVARRFGDECLLTAFAAGGFAAIGPLLAERLDGRLLVVDGADALAPGRAKFEDPGDAYWRSDVDALLGWVSARAQRGATVVVSRRPLGLPDVNDVCHAAPDAWTLKRVRASGGFRDWELLARVAGGNPASLVLARALVPLLPAAQFNELVTTASDDGIRGTDLIRFLAEELQANAPRSWQRCLSLLVTLKECPRDAPVPLLEEKGRRPVSFRGMLETRAEPTPLDQLARLAPSP